MQFIDKFGFWNVKEVGPSKDPSGNDGAIVTAYALKVGFTIDWQNLWNTRDLVKKKNEIPIERHPGKPYPPPSRDTMLGLVALGMLHPETLIAGNWLFCPFKIPPFNPFSTISALLRLKKSHRNALWEGKGEPHVFRFAFSVPLVDRAFMLRHVGMPVNYFYSLVEWIDKKFTSSSPSSKLIRWLKYDEMPEQSVFDTYFGREHPIALMVKGKFEVSQ